MLSHLDFPDARLYLQGAHLAQFKDWLFLSSRSHFEEGRVIRGGIPVVFPWFGPKRDDSAAPQHGWARTALWELWSQSESGAILGLEREGWQIIVEFVFGETLGVNFTVHNLGEQPRSFECALHTYFAVSDIAHVEIEGLDGRAFIDKTDGGARKTQQGAVRFRGEVDWVFPDARAPIFIRDGETGYELSGDWDSVVVWNPAGEKAALMSDLGEGEWKRFVCVEVGAIAEGAIELGVGEWSSMELQISRLYSVAREGRYISASSF